ncbi:MAG TPA: hypothetical protein VGT05_05215 [Patescibacteria group bacterium]|nr:hypothetical protein [Patescibacteria group bacterium]
MKKDDWEQELKELQDQQKKLDAQKKKYGQGVADEWYETECKKLKKLMAYRIKKLNYCKNLLTDEEIEKINTNAEKGQKMDEKRELAKQARASQKHDEEIMQSVEGEIIEEQQSEVL